MEKRVAIGLLAACSIACGACGNKSAPTPSKDPGPPPSVTASAAAPSVTASAAAPATIPTLAAEKFAPAGSKPTGLFTIENAIMVSEGPRVGRIVNDGIEWAGAVFAGSDAFGPSIIQTVHGRWPDGVDATYTSSHGRAPMPTYEAVTGKGKGTSHTVASGGGGGRIDGVARLGASTILSTFWMAEGPALVTVRGPKLPHKAISVTQGGCKPGDANRWSPDTPADALERSAIESTPDGTLVAIGNLCDKGPAAEVWDKAGKSRILQLDRWWKKMAYWPKLFKGAGDELFAYSDAWKPILRYHDGAFEPVADLGRPVVNVFVSPDGKLHAYDGQTIHRHEEGKWTAVARLAEPKKLRAFAVEKDSFYAMDGAVLALRETARGPAPEGCATWFVYLYEAADKNEPKFTYPATRKALSSFPQVADLGLVEIRDDYKRHLGLTVTSRGQGEAVMAHLEANMKDEDPKLFCFEPKDPRKIEIDPKGR